MNSDYVRGALDILVSLGYIDAQSNGIEPGYLCSDGKSIFFDDDGLSIRVNGESIPFEDIISVKYKCPTTVVFVVKKWCIETY